MIHFVEAKEPDMTRIAELLERCRISNHWANRGPLYDLLSDRYANHMNIPEGCQITPCANGGIALEAMSRLMGQIAGKPLRWIVSAFSFQNLGRGHFSDVSYVDCTDDGLMDMNAVLQLPPSSYDGLIVVNPFGLHNDFSHFIEFARTSGKRLLLDNAAGVHDRVPNWPWQSFSLHHTKPYGMGEGGLALTPANEAEALYQLLDYADAPNPEHAWLNNGKISDIASAFLIDRLEKSQDWVPLYQDQSNRVTKIAVDAGLRPLQTVVDTAQRAPATSSAFVSTQKISLESMRKPERLKFGKYYKPLRNLPKTQELYAHLVNIPTHPDVANLSDSELRDEIYTILLANQEANS